MLGGVTHHMLPHLSRVNRPLNTMIDQGKFGFRIIWRIMKIEEGVIRRGRLGLKIIPSLRTSQNMLSSIDVKFIFDSACLSES